MLNNKPIYFDNAATTIPNEEVVKVYVDALKSNYYNPSSVHALGNNNLRVLDKTRKDILSLFNMKNHQVIFTSGATESNNLALKGFAHRYKARGKHIISTSVEHPSVLNTLKSLEEEGFTVTLLPVNNECHIALNDLKKAIRKDTILVSIMAVNNEVGAINDIAAIKEVLKEFPNVKLHVDAVQAVGKVNLPYNDIDLLTVSLHKLGGLKSTGLLIKRNDIDLSPIIDGGGQEFGLRSGTNDVPMAIADVKTVEIALSHFSDYDYMSELVKPIYKYLLAHKDLFEVNSELINPYIINFSTLTKKASVIKEALSNEGIMVASKSACSSRLESGSPTLIAMGKNTVVNSNSIRLSFCKDNTKEEVSYFLDTLDNLIKRIR